MKSVRVRIAPSPSGFLHVGTARTAVYNYLFSRHHGGAFILRVEDTDVARSSPEMVAGILEGLQWLGLTWDEGPVFQSRRFDLYRQYAEKLFATGQAYFCFCTPEELEQKRSAAIAQKIAWKYDRTCRQLSDAERQKKLAAGVPKAMRLFVPEGETVFRDSVYGELRRHNADTEDFVCLRSNGRPTYNFACVADDADMQISHVIRGNDHISNTFKQILLYRALGLEPPEFAHLPLILGPDRAKVSKRHGAESVTEFRDRGFLPETVLNFLALLGWSPGDEREILSRKELIDLFSLERVTQANPIFDMQKLEWMSGEYLRALPDEQLLDCVLPHLQAAGLVTQEAAQKKREWLVRLIPLLKERARTLVDFASVGRYFFTDQFDYDPQGVAKQFADPQAAERLAELAKRFRDLSLFNKETADEALRSYALALGVKPALLIHPTRLALTGVTMGPGLFDIVATLGQAEVVKRLEKAVVFLRTQKPVSIR